MSICNSYVIIAYHTAFLPNSAPVSLKSTKSQESVGLCGFMERCRLPPNAKLCQTAGRSHR